MVRAATTMTRRAAGVAGVSVTATGATVMTAAPTVALTAAQTAAATAETVVS